MIPLKYPQPAEFFRDEAREIVVSAETKRIWAVELDLLREFDRVCRKHRLRYFADSGTLLGAVRHGGFIPWDDDIDVTMARAEYDNLLAIAEKEFKQPYFLQTDGNSPEAARGHAQLRNSETTGILTSESKDGKGLFPFNQGIFIDIFPLDNLPDEDNERRLFLMQLTRFKDRIVRYREALKVLRGGHGRWYSPSTVYHGLLGLWLLCIKRLFRQDLLVRKEKHLERLCRTYDSTDTLGFAAINFRPRRRSDEFYLRADFSETTALPFENIKIPAPVKYEAVLTRSYGDWHRHVIGGAMHGGVIFDVDRSYRAYLR